MGVIIEDSSTPAVVTQASGTTSALTTASFTPPAGMKLLALWAGNSTDPTAPTPPTIANSGTALTWTAVQVSVRGDGVTPVVDGQAAAWVATVPAAWGSQTVTVNNNAASGTRHAALAVRVLDGVDDSIFGANSKGSQNSGTTITVNYTAQRSGSRGYIVVSDWSAVGAETAGTGMTLISSANIGAPDISYGVFRRTSNDGVAGASNSLNVTLPATSANIRFVGVEILPSGDAAAAQSPLLGLPPKMPPAMVMAAMAARYGPDAGATTPIMPETGTGTIFIVGTGAAVKVVAQTGAGVLPVRTSGVGAKRAPQAAAGALALAGAGTDVKRAPQAGTAGLAVAGTGVESTASARAQTGAGVLALRASGLDVKRAVEQGVAGLTVAGTGADVKRAVEQGTAELAIRQGGAEIHQQAETGSAKIAVRGTAAVTKIAKESGTAAAAVSGTGAAAKRTAQTGTAGLGVTGTGFEQSGVSRAQTGAGVLPIRAAAAVTKRAVVTGAAMLATVGQSTAGKRTPQAGAVAAAVRTSALVTKKVAAAGRGAVAISPLGAGGKRISAAGRTVVPILGFGNATLELPPVRLGDRLDDILNALVSFTLRLGIFQRVQQHEPKSAPRNGLTAALWLQAMEPALGESSLSSTSLRVSWYLRVYQNFLSEPQDMIDPSVMKACAAVMEALTANFDLDLPQVRAIDLLGITGPPMRADAGYVPMGPANAPKIFRCMTLTIPVIVDDAFVQAA